MNFATLFRNRTRPTPSTSIRDQVKLYRYVRITDKYNIDIQLNENN